MRILAVDIGTVRIGFAISDPQQIIAQALPTLESGSAKQICTKIIEVIKKYETAPKDEQIDKVVLGLPIHLNGKDSEMSLFVKECSQILKMYIIQKIKRRIEIVFKDERMTSISAERVMLEGNASRKVRRQKKDQIAAQIILMEYLNANKHN